MSATSLDVFDTTLQKTNEWLKEIMQEVGTESRQEAYTALRSTLHTLRERLPVEATAHWGAQLPMLIRGMFYEGWHPNPQVNKMTRDEFLEGVRTFFARTIAAESGPEMMVRAVFRVLSRKVAWGEVNKIIHLLPSEFRDLWPPADLGSSRAQAV